MNPPKSIRSDENDRLKRSSPNLKTKQHTTLKEHWAIQVLKREDLEMQLVALVSGRWIAMKIQIKNVAAMFHQAPKHANDNPNGSKIYTSFQTILTIVGGR